MNIGEPIVATYQGWFATWHGGEYIDVFHDEDEARADARGEKASSVAVINTTGDTFGETREDWEAYVRDELMGWVRTDAADYAANGY